MTQGCMKYLFAVREDSCHRESWHNYYRQKAILWPPLLASPVGVREALLLEVGAHPEWGSPSRGSQALIKNSLWESDHSAVFNA